MAVNERDGIWYHAMWYGRDATDALFALHEACIELGCRVIDCVRGGPSAKPSLDVLYQCLKTHVFNRHRHAQPEHRAPAHDIFDLRLVLRTRGPRSALGLSRLEW